MDELTELRKVLEKWVSRDNYSKATEYGKMLDKLVHYLPTKIQEVPENVPLYRGVVVQEEAFDKLFDKLLSRNKPLTLKGREYSSWTIKPRVAEYFGLPMSWGIGVVLTRKFSKQALLLDVNKVAAYLDMQLGRKWAESEIIVKNSNIDYKFTIKEVMMYYRDKENGWQKL